MPKIVTLVPFSSSDESRIKVWRCVRRWYDDSFPYPLFVGESTDGVFNLSLARNRAAEKAGDWDVAVIFDADTVVDVSHVNDGIKKCLNNGAVTYPFTERWELNATGTKMFLENPRGKWQPYAEKFRWEAIAGCIIVRRDLWDLVRGFDPGFVGWGHEDGAFLSACNVLSGKKPNRIIGKSLHLEHNPSESKNPNNELYLKNKNRIDRYIKAANSPDSKIKIKKLRDETIGII